MGIAINGGNLVKSDGLVLGKVVHEKCGHGSVIMEKMCGWAGSGLQH